MACAAQLWPPSSELEEQECGACPIMKDQNVLFQNSWMGCESEGNAPDGKSADVGDTSIKPVSIRCPSVSQSLVNYYVRYILVISSLICCTLRTPEPRILCIQRHKKSSNSLVRTGVGTVLCETDSKVEYIIL